MADQKISQMGFASALADADYGPLVQGGINKRVTYQTLYGYIANKLSVANLYVPIAGGTMTGYLSLNADPTNASHAATKNYVDNLITGLSWKSAVKAATTTNITLSGTQTIDGVTCSVGDRVLVKNQTTQTTNGIYVVASGAWVRAADDDAAAEILGATVYVQNGGTINGNTQWSNNNTSVIVGTTNITFVQISGAGTYTNGVGLSLTGNAFSLDLTRVATSGITGLLSSTDWSTFNNKQAALNGTGFVKISGTTITYDNSTYLTSSSSANPTTSIGLFAVNGSASTFMRSDAAPNISQAIVPTWTGKHIFNASASGANSSNFEITGTTASTANSQILYGVKINPTFDNSGNFTINARVLDVQAGFGHFVMSLSNTLTGFTNPNNEPSFIIDKVGTSGAASLLFFNTNPTSTLYAGIRADFGGEIRMGAIGAGSGYYTTLYSNGAEVARFQAGKVGIGVTSVTALLHLKAGTATAGTAPLKFNSGTNLTTPDNGTMEFDGTNLYVTAQGTRQNSLKGYSGSYNGTGTGTTAFTVTFGGTQPNTTYQVVITPTNALTASVLYVTSKTTTTFTVTFLTGLTGAVTFDWVLIQ